MVRSGKRWLMVMLTLFVLSVSIGRSVLYAQQEAQSLEELKNPPWAGLWTGSGVTFEMLMNDPIRKLSRRSEASFWFVVGKDGSVRGEAIVAYSATLETINFQIPLPNVGTIDAKVGGNAPKRFFRIGIGGQLVDADTALPPGKEDWDEGQTLALHLVALGEDEEGKAAEEQEGRIPGVKFEFGITASLVIPAGWGLGKAKSLAEDVPPGSLKGALQGVGLGSMVLPGANPGVWTIQIAATGWSPFQGIAPKAEHGPDEPFRAIARKDWKDGSFVFWSAVQQGGAPDKLNRLVDRIRILEGQRVAGLEAVVTRLQADAVALESSLMAAQHSREQLRSQVERQRSEIKTLVQQLRELRSLVDQQTRSGGGG